ncbi:Mycobacterium numidiamassiliense ORFan [Mycobacterium numidiamassiliense]|uniref:Mycobacterium numidiamassiliense ORFan n=1 Tax=Mycobacterium numidiamassiliense TaxID=1841861 RepID=A0A2U3PIM6_9MYCO|nr:hypothetical protein [Mycobacterium numidiamassiliense]SPM43598.1 Mycobacterium numidiamassiliense ORFan [Mycobacterium numidiamassiliense]
MENLRDSLVDNDYKGAAMPMDEQRARGIFALVTHARRRYGGHITLDDLTPDQLNLVRADRDTAVTAAQQRGVRARRLNKAARLRAEADEIEAQVLAGVSA